jgi:hypothetical protein
MWGGAGWCGLLWGGGLWIDVGWSGVAWIIGGRNGLGMGSDMDFCFFFLLMLLGTRGYSISAQLKFYT